jgi:hypothetical protein
MACQHMDNFSLYGGVAANMLNGVYAAVPQVTLATDPDGISTGKVVHINNNNPAGPRYVLSSAQAVIGVCARMWAPNLSFNAAVLPGIAWYDVSGTPMVIMNFDTTGRVRLLTRAGGLIATSTNPVITANGWYHIEAKLVSGAGSTDTFEVRIEGIPVLVQGASDLDIESIYQVQIGTPAFSGSGGSATDIYWKDFFIWDGSGTHNNDFVGSVIIYDLTPTADVALNWTPVGGPNGFSILDNAPPNDTIFLQAPNPAPAAYQASHSPLPADVTSVKAIMTMVRAAKSDGGDASLQMGVISDPSGAPATALGADRPITIAQTYWRDVFETDPKTSAAWLPSAVDASLIQINRTA